MFFLQLHWSYVAWEKEKPRGRILFSLCLVKNKHYQHSMIYDYWCGLTLVTWLPHGKVTSFPFPYCPLGKELSRDFSCPSFREEICRTYLEFSMHGRVTSSWILTHLCLYLGYNPIVFFFLKLYSFVLLKLFGLTPVSLIYSYQHGVVLTF